MNHITNKTPTNLHYPEKSVFMKAVITQNFWTFHLGVQESVNVPIWIYVVFQKSDRQHDQSLNNDTFYRMSLTSAQYIIGTEKYPYNATLSNYDDDDYSQGYGQTKETFRALIKDNILQPYISEDDFGSSNDGDNNCDIIQSFDKRYQKNFENCQSVEVEFKFDDVVPANVIDMINISFVRSIFLLGCLGLKLVYK